MASGAGSHRCNQRLPSACSDRGRRGSLPCRPARDRAWACAAHVPPPPEPSARCRRGSCRRSRSHRARPPLPDPHNTSGRTPRSSAAHRAPGSRSRARGYRRRWVERAVESHPRSRSKVPVRSQNPPTDGLGDIRVDRVEQRLGRAVAAAPAERGQLVAARSARPAHRPSSRAIHRCSDSGRRPTPSARRRGRRSPSP